MASRTRSRGGFVALPGYNTYQGEHHVSCFVTTPIAFVRGRFTTGTYETMSDTVIPRFQSRRAKGEVFFNPMQYEKRVSGISSGTGWEHINNVQTNCGGTLVNKRYYSNPGDDDTDNFIASAFGSGLNGSVPVTGILTPSEIGLLVSEASTRVRANRGLADSNTFESLAEINQTVKMLGSPIRGLNKFLNRNLSRIRAMDGAKAWLAYRYGVRPFVNDINTIVGGLAKPVGRRRKTTRASLSLSRSGESSAFGVLGSYRCLVNKQIIDEVLVRAMSLDEFEATLGFNTGFTGKGLMGLPWELISHSFVVDWFVNVGDFLYAHLPAFGYKQLGSCVTIRRRITNVYTVMYNNFLTAGFTVTKQPGGTNYGSIETVTRQALSAPSLQVKSDFRFHELTRVADGMALLAVQLGKLFSKSRHGIR